MKELGYCNGVENYFCFFDGCKLGICFFCLLDYFFDDYFMLVDESYVMFFQVWGMFGGDCVWKLSLVNFGFCFFFVMDNCLLNFIEFESFINQVVYVSVIFVEYELEQMGGVLVEQVICFMGLVDLFIEVCLSINQIDDLMEEIDE